MDLPAAYQLSAAALATQSPLPLTILPDLTAFNHHVATAIAQEIATQAAANRPTRLILPVGPVGYFAPLAKLCNAQQISWANVHAFFMDEYCDWQGRRVGPDHPLSFAGFAQRALFDQLAEPLALPPAQLHFPDPLHIDRISEAIAAVGGIDTCYGGIGIHGHIAFNEPPISRWFTLTPAEFKASQTRLVQLAPETVVMNASRAASGNLAALPPMAVTLGMADILAAKRIRLYCQGGVWQRTVLRIALFGSPTTTDGEDVNYPVTLLRNHPDLAIVTTVETAQPPIPQMAA
ncbi:MAG: 6-phosphogluconolactonase [Caldilineaceae bacterium]|nr:6-phosphogluconolactonase [Caldilineaceae bacterium]